MIAILSEPSTYVCMEKSNSAFARFARSVLRLVDLFEVNPSAKFILTRELAEASLNCLDPKLQGVHVERPVRPNVQSSPVVYLLLQLLNQYSVTPKYEYASREDGVLFEPVLEENGILYQDPDIKILWKDLIAQTAFLTSEHATYTREILAAESEESCFGEKLARQNVKQIDLGNELANFEILRPFLGQWPSEIIEPDVFFSLASRRGKDPALPTCTYEDSGHQPSRQIKKVLERTAFEARKFTLRMNTIYFNPDAVAVSKLELHANFNQILFQICDNQSVVRGYFTTVAQTTAEQQIVLSQLLPSFIDRCKKEGFPI